MKGEDGPLDLGEGNCPGSTGLGREPTSELETECLGANQ